MRFNYVMPKLNCIILEDFIRIELDSNYLIKLRDSLNDN